MKAKPKCRVCGAELNDTNWCLSWRERHQYICKRCKAKYQHQWRKANPDKAKAISTRGNRKHGFQPFYENKQCAQYLGVHVAESVLSQVFKDVQRMPNGNPGFDFKCRYGYKIDVKGSCLTKKGGWLFTIGRNTVPDYFLCLAFDNREDLNPLHVWLLPGDKFNHYAGTTISRSTIHKWDEYRLDITKVKMCCDAMRGVL